MTIDAVDADVVVVGGGPAGAAAAFELARRGRSVVVCERSQLPRDKSCGDGLTPRAVQALIDMGLGGRVGAWQPVRGVRAHGRGRTRTFEFPSGGSWPSAGVVVPRRELDLVVLDRARVEGATVIEGTDVTDVSRSDAGVVGVRTKRDGEADELRARWVVCADGAGGKVARALGVVPQAGAQRALAMRQYYPGRPIGGAWFDVFLDVRVEGRIVPGYGWVFPVGDGTVNAGIGFNSSAPRWKGSNLHSLMRAFEERLPPEWGIRPETALCDPRAGRLPLGGGVGPLHGPGFAMVGDAAGWINPATGEGIAYAYETGRMVGRHLDGALAEGRRSLGGYEAELRSRYRAYFRIGRLVALGLGRRWSAEAMVAACMSTRIGFDFAMTLFTHLEETDRTPTHMAMRAMQRVAAVLP